ncbi:hypothetical protein AMTR_s00047p00183890 [Amborella trichopoda]|uniref:Uncharacterized protein n=1 Tax=Amborella trichopoda TaxID=13333 RepID=U5CWW3_AMBTC|nr:hypothetical protein AMTR_s00047p00183890 [Amborella trichopoda]
MVKLQKSKRLEQVGVEDHPKYCILKAAIRSTILLSPSFIRGWSSLMASRKRGKIVSLPILPMWPKVFARPRFEPHPLRAPFHESPNVKRAIIDSLPDVQRW